MGKPRNLLVITYWSCADALVQTYVVPYLLMILAELPQGSVVHLVTLESSGAGKVELPKGIVHHRFRYHPLGIGGLWMMIGMVVRLIPLIFRERIEVIHAWCMPAGMIGHLLSVLSGRSLVIDSYEPHAEAMVENGTWKRKSVAFAMLFFSERLQTRRAKVVIAAAEGMRDYAARSYGMVPRHFFVKPACVDLEQFSVRNLKKPDLLSSLGFEGKIVAVYAGKFGGIYQDVEVFTFFRVARDHWRDRFHVLLLTTYSQDELALFMDHAGLDPAIFTILKVSHKDIPDYMGLGDFALTPVKPVPTKRYCTPIKDGEYWALGLPVVITPNISDDSAIIEKYGIGSVLRGNQPEDVRRSIEEIDRLLSMHDRQSLYRLVRPIAEEYRSYAIAERVYHAIYGPGGLLFR